MQRMKKARYACQAPKPSFFPFDPLTTQMWGPLNPTVLFASTPSTDAALTRIQLAAGLTATRGQLPPFRILPSHHMGLGHSPTLSSCMTLRTLDGLCFPVCLSRIETATSSQGCCKDKIKEVKNKTSTQGLPRSKYSINVSD